MHHIDADGIALNAQRAGLCDALVCLELAGDETNATGNCGCFDEGNHAGVDVIHGFGQRGNRFGQVAADAPIPHEGMPGNDKKDRMQADRLEHGSEQNRRVDTRPLLAFQDNLGRADGLRGLPFDTVYQCFCIPTRRWVDVADVLLE